MAKILIVDDNLDILPIYQYLNSESLEFLTADNGLQALSVLEENEDIQAVLLDLSMPTLDGIATVEEIRRNEIMHPKKKPLRLAFFTASTVDSVIHRVQLANNIERVFMKPIAPDVLVQRIKEWLNV